jgi:hypothetical protein
VSLKIIERKALIEMDLRWSEVAHPQETRSHSEVALGKESCILLALD